MQVDDLIVLSSNRNSDKVTISHNKFDWEDDPFTNGDNVSKGMTYFKIFVLTMMQLVHVWLMIDMADYWANYQWPLMLITLHHVHGYIYCIILML